MRGSPSRWTIVVGGVVVLMIATSIGLRWAAARHASRAADPHAGADAPPAPRANPAAAKADDLPVDVSALSSDEDVANSVGEDAADPAARAWATVDMDAIRKALPDNTYWRMAAPTKDPEVLKAREEERARWNVEYGKVLSNTATAEEVDAYYANRQRLSQDYLEFIVYLLTNYGYQIPRRDVAALKLAAEMHNARLEEIPRQLAEAHERREAHEAARRAWLEQQQAFNADATNDAR